MSTSTSQGPVGLARISIAASIALICGLVAVFATTSGALTFAPQLEIEAENGQLIGRFAAQQDADASGGAYVAAEKRVGNTKVFDAADGVMFCFDALEAGEYSFSADVMAPNNGANSFIVRVDYYDEWVWDVEMSKSYEQQKVTDHTGAQVKTQLEPGQHVVGFYLRDSGTRLDRVYVQGQIGMDGPELCGAARAVEASASESTIAATSTTTAAGHGGGSTTTTTPSPTTTSNSPTTTASDSPTTTSSGSPATTTPGSPTTTSSGSSPTTSSPTTTTTPPSSGGSYDVVLRPGDSIQAAVKNNPQGTTFLLKAGLYRRQEVKPKSGMSFIGESGAVLDGEGVTDYAFMSWQNDNINNVTIANLEIKNYTPGEAHGAISSYGTGWVVDHCDVHHSSTAGVKVAGSNSVVRDSYLHNNEKIGLKAKGNNVRIENNEISYNNIHDRFDPNWEAGGIKFGGGANGTIIRGNYIHHNHGHGVWSDMGSINSVYDRNVIDNNTLSGINHEISYDAVIKNNTIRNNGFGDSRDWMWGAGIQVRGPNVEIYGNVIKNNKNGIALIQGNRGSGPYGSYNLKNIRVHDNLIIESGRNGGVRSSGPSDIFDTSQFDRNEYRYSNMGAKLFDWDDGRGNKDWWQSHDQDHNGAFKTI